MLHKDTIIFLYKKTETEFNSEQFVFVSLDQTVIKMLSNTSTFK